MDVFLCGFFQDCGLRAMLVFEGWAFSWFKALGLRFGATPHCKHAVQQLLPLMPLVYRRIFAYFRSGLFSYLAFDHVLF